MANKFKKIENFQLKEKKTKELINVKSVNLQNSPKNLGQYTKKIKDQIYEMLKTKILKKIRQI